MVGHLALSLTRTHIPSPLQTNALLIKYWGVPVAKWAEIQFLSSLMELSIFGRSGGKGRERRRGKDTVVKEKGTKGRVKSGESKRKERGKGWDTSWTVMKRRNWQQCKETEQNQMEEKSEARTVTFKCIWNFNMVWQIRSCFGDQKQSSHHENLSPKKKMNPFSSREKRHFFPMQADWLVCWWVKYLYFWKDCYNTCPNMHAPWEWIIFVIYWLLFCCVFTLMDECPWSLVHQCHVQHVVIPGHQSKYHANTQDSLYKISWAVTKYCHLSPLDH